MKVGWVVHDTAENRESHHLDGRLLGREVAYDAQQILHRHIAEGHRLMAVAQLLASAHLQHVGTSGLKP